MKVYYCWAWLLVMCFLQNNVFCKQTDKAIVEVSYQPTWESLDSRPLPGWYDDAKFGIFLHWGVYSVPSWGVGAGEWFWKFWKSNNKGCVNFMNQSYAPGFSYQEFAPEFKAEFFDADKWAKIFENAGAKYVVLTTKHHEGYTLWPSKHSFSWNSVDVGSHRDLVGDLSTAIRKRNKMRFGVYYSLMEWYNPMYLRDMQNKFTTREYVDQKMIPDLVELFENYKPEVLWCDGDWDATDDYFRSKEILAWLYNNSTVKDSIVVNDRWGQGIPCHHGGYYTCADKFNPHTLQKHKWEGCHSVDKLSWGYRRNAQLKDLYSVKELIELLVTTVSCGGNLLLNVGPMKDGLIALVYEDRLQGVGQWLKINGEAIFKTKPWIHQNDTANGNVWYTASKEIHSVSILDSNEVKDLMTVYAMVLEWPKNRQLYVEDLTNHLDLNESQIFMLGNEKLPLKWTQSGEGVWITFPQMDVVKSQLSWCLKITNVNN